MIHLTAIVLTFNEAGNVRDCIESLRFADRILVFDSFSADQTVAIAEACGADVIQHTFENYAAQRNAALDAVAGATDWVFFVDADERIGNMAASEVRRKLADTNFAAWRLPRDNYIFGVLTKGSGWHPDYQTRLLRVGAARFDPERTVHEVVQIKGRVGTLENAIVHYNYRDLAHFVEKQERYVRFDAEMLFEQGIRPRFRNYVLQPLRHFIWRFYTLRGYKDRWHGFRLSALMAWYEYRKYRLLATKWHRE